MALHKTQIADWMNKNFKKEKLLQKTHEIKESVFFSIFSVKYQFQFNITLHYITLAGPGPLDTFRSFIM